MAKPSFYVVWIESHRADLTYLAPHPPSNTSALLAPRVLAVCVQQASEITSVNLARTIGCRGKPVNR